MNAIKDKLVQAKFTAYPEQYRQPLLIIRALIFDIAGSTDGVGSITETLKWSQPSYLTEESGSGTTIRLDQFGINQITIFVHCQTTLIGSFKTLFPELHYSKNRAIVLDLNKPLPIDILSLFIEMALTYQLNKKTRTTEK
ncbi:hypothetical protein [Neisseria sp. Ec49-e6-T10]|uniref:hypothetical protein n=1 Tax=Neisseria sp. Ec49-e6-T10 TaxID=3140744 RepID=UPI003EC12487